MNIKKNLIESLRKKIGIFNNNQYKTKKKN